MQNKILLLFVLLSIFMNKAKCQTALPKIIPPSPEASAFFKFLDYPVDHSTGVPQINIPLHEIRSGKLNLPISISYHASGRKVTDQSGPIGLGWSLNAGGMISRTVYGAPEFGTPGDGSYPFPYPFRLEEDLMTPNDEEDFSYLVGIEHHKTSINYGHGVNKWVDSEYDVFSYSFNGNNGKFIFKDINGVKTPVFIPLKPYKLEWEVNQELNLITIIDDNGNKYHFSGGERFLQGTYQVMSSWFLKQIISSDMADTISFKYEAFNQERVSFSQDRVLFDDWYKADEPWDNYLQDRENKNTQLYQVQRLKEITFKHGKVYFDIDTKNDMVKNIQIKNHNDEIIKSIELSQSILNTFLFGNEPAYKVDKISFKDKHGISNDKYSFDYYPNALFGESSMNIKYHDWWGYYNATERNTMIPGYKDIPYRGTGGESTIDFGGSIDILEPKLEGVQSGVLKKITYPTGGSTEFIYGLNRYKDIFSGAIKNCGGLRIHQIITKDDNKNTSYKSYKYGENEGGYGFIELTPSIATTSYESRYVLYMYLENLFPDVYGTYRERVFTSSFLPSLGFLADRPIIYPEVTEYHGTESENIGKTIYKYKNYIQTPQRLAHTADMSMQRFHVYDYNYWKTNSLLEKSDYKRIINPGGTPYKLQKKINFYYQVNNIENVIGLHVQRTHIFPQGDDLSPRAYLDEHAAVNEKRTVYGYSNYVVSVGTKNLYLTIDSSFTDNNSEIVNKINYTYNSRQLISETEKKTSDNAAIKEVRKYSFDFPADITLSEMVDLNMLNYVVENSKYNNSKPLGSIKTVYKNWGGSVFTPEKLYTKLGEATSYDLRLRYYAYDNNSHPLTVSMEEGPLFSYIYGYNNDFPIAEIKNAAQSQTFHTSFEGDDGNSNDKDCRTGVKSRTNGFQKTLSGLADGPYHLTFWQKSGSKWELVELNNINVTNSTYTINISGQVDEIRFYPVGAYMTTYTYDPFNGITSSTDENNITTYYSYDSFNRLQAIRDNNGHILKQYNYQYK